MSQLRNRLEAGFETLARRVYRHPLATLLVLLTLTAPLLLQLPKLEFDLSTEGFLHPDDPTLEDYNAFRDQFGRDEVIIVAIRPKAVFDRTFLKTLEGLHRNLEDHVPYLEDVTSLVNARNTRGREKALIVEDLLDTFPQTREQMQAFKQRVMSNELYRNLLISTDGRMTAIVIRTQAYGDQQEPEDVLAGFENTAAPPDEDPSDLPGRYLTNAQNSEAVRAVQQVLAPFRSDEMDIWLAGSPVVTHTLKLAMMKDMRKFVVLAIGAIALFLFIMFRKISGVVLPLIVVALSVLSTFGLLAATHTPIKLPTQIMPSFLLAVCVGAAVHILAMFYRHLEQSADKEASVTYALGHSGLPCVMTHITTALGLLSFSTADLAPIADIGVFASLGVLIALMITLFLLPAALALLPVRRSRSGGGKAQAARMDRLLSKTAAMATGHPIRVLVLTFMLLAASTAMIPGIRFGHDPLRWFPADSHVRTATEKLDHALRGTVSLEVIVDTHAENGLYEPSLLNRLESASDHIQGLEHGEVFVGKAWSVTTILKEIHQALNENQSAYYRIPDNRDLIAQEFLLFENSGSDDLEDVVDSAFSKARLSIKAPFTDALKYRPLLTEVTHTLEARLATETTTLTGMMALLIRTLSNVVISMAKSYIFAILVISLLMVLLIGRLRIGLMSMIPNVSPIVVMLGAMGALSLPMDAFTMMVGSIAIGLAVDDTIHFMHHFRRYYERSGDPHKAVQQTLLSTGRAMLVTSIVLSIGFFIFMFADMRNIFNFGLLTGITIILALLADFFLAPALMVLAHRRHRLKGIIAGAAPAR